MWDKLEEIAQTGILQCPREVSREIKKSKELQTWIKSNKIIIPDDVNSNIIPLALNIDRKYPKLKIGGRRKKPKKDSADPWVVALAQYTKGKVICSETSDPKAKDVYKIPDACRKEGTLCISLPELFDELNIRIVKVR